MTRTVAESGAMYTANGWQPWDAWPMPTLNALDDNPGLDSQMDVEK